MRYFILLLGFYLISCDKEEVKPGIINNTNQYHGDLKYFRNWSEPLIGYQEIDTTYNDYKIEVRETEDSILFNMAPLLGERKFKKRSDSFYEYGSFDVDGVNCFCNGEFRIKGDSLITRTRFYGGSAHGYPGDNHSDFRGIRK